MSLPFFAQLEFTQWFLTMTAFLNSTRNTSGIGVHMLYEELGVQVVLLQINPSQ